MIQSTATENKVKQSGAPDGGSVKRAGLDIDWQKGPVPVEKLPEAALNALGLVTVDTVIDAARQRLVFLNHSEDNAHHGAKVQDAIVNLEAALQCLAAYRGELEEDEG